MQPSICIKHVNKTFIIIIINMHDEFDSWDNYKVIGIVSFLFKLKYSRITSCDFIIDGKFCLNIQSTCVSMCNTIL